MFILGTDHVSLFQRNDRHASARVLATPQDLATTVITLEEQSRGRLDRIRRARSDAEVVGAYHKFLATSLLFRTIIVMSVDFEVDCGLLPLMSFTLHRERRPEAVAITALCQSQPARRTDIVSGGAI
jgi:hypothetical protein